MCEPDAALAPPSRADGPLPPHLSEHSPSTPPDADSFADVDDGAASWAGVLRRGGGAVVVPAPSPPAFAPPGPSLGPARPALPRSFRRWKWEAASLHPSAVVPTLSRRSLGTPPAPTTLGPPAGLRTSPPALAALPARAPAAEAEASLLALMPRLGPGRPAAAAAAAAFRALAPFLSEADRSLLRDRFAMHARPLDVLRHVLDAAEVASLRYDAVMAPARPAANAHAGDGVWPGLWPTSPRGRVPGQLAAVWGRDEGATGTRTDQHDSPWLYSPSTGSTASPRSSTYHPPAGPF